MKIVQIVPAMDQGGVELGVVEMNRFLVEAGHDNLVISVGGRLEKDILAAGGRVKHLDVKSKNPITVWLRAMKLRKCLKAERPDVVVVHSRVPAWLFVIANRTLKLKWITFAQGANSVSLYSKVMTYGDLTLTPSRYIADYLKRNYGIHEEKLRIISPAIDADKFDLEKLDRAFIAAKKAEWKTEGFRVIMGVGRITQLKGFDILIRALAYLHGTHKAAGVDSPDYKLVIVGEAEALRKEYEAQLHALVKQLDVEDYVVFAGAQSKIAECMSIADVVVSSNWKKPEAFGRSMAEALACGKPVVATAFGGALDIVEDGKNGALIPPMKDAMPEERAISFANAIRSVVHTKFGDLRTPVLEKFSFARMVDAFLSLFQEFSTH